MITAGKLAPRTPLEVTDEQIILPNASVPPLVKAAGQGSTVSLGRVPAGRGVGFFVVANGWASNGRTVGGVKVPEAARGRGGGGVRGVKVPKPEPKLVLLGDYIDRGRFSYNGVLRAVMSGSAGPVEFATSRLADIETMHAMTIHKSQGSQWNSVLIFDESWCFREDANRWLYTAITRAQTKVLVYQT